MWFTVRRSWADDSSQTQRDIDWLRTVVWLQPQAEAVPCDSSTLLRPTDWNPSKRRSWYSVLKVRNHTIELWGSLPNSGLSSVWVCYVLDRRAWVCTAIVLHCILAEVVVVFNVALAPWSRKTWRLIEGIARIVPLRERTVCRNCFDGETPCYWLNWLTPGRIIVLGLCIWEYMCTYTPPHAPVSVYACYTTLAFTWDSLT